MPLSYVLYIAAALLSLACGYAVLAHGSQTKLERFARIAQLLILCAIVALSVLAAFYPTEASLAVQARV